VDPQLEEELGRALSLGEEGDWQGMAERLDPILEDHPENPVVLCWMGVAEHGMGLESSSYERFKACLALDPTDPYVLAMAGQGLARSDDPDAESALRNASVVGPNVAQTRVAYGGYLAREGMLDDALVQLDAALELAPEDTEALIERGVALGLADRRDQAAESFLRAWEIDQTDGWSRSLAGLAEIEAGQFEAAAGNLIDASLLRPEDVEIAVAAALVAAVIDREDLAYQALEGARMRLDSDDLDARQLVLVEDSIEGGPEAAKRFLVQQYAPGLYRRRLMVRP